LKLRQQDKVFLTLNKIDEIPHDLLLSQIEEFNTLGVYAEIFMISALNLGRNYPRKVILAFA